MIEMTSDVCHDIVLRNNFIDMILIGILTIKF